MSVPVIIQEGGASAPSTGRYACARGHVLEGAIATIVQQLVGTEIGEIQVWIAVVIVIAYRGSHTVAVPLNSGSDGHIHKSKPAEIAVESIEINRIFLAYRRQGGSVHKVQVEQSVVIVVEQRTP